MENAQFQIAMVLMHLVGRRRALCITNAFCSVERNNSQGKESTNIWRERLQASFVTSTFATTFKYLRC